MGTVCRVRGSEKLPEEFKRILGIEAGETTPDGKFFPDCLWCVGAYGKICTAQQSDHDAFSKIIFTEYKPLQNL